MSDKIKEMPLRERLSNIMIEIDNVEKNIQVSAGQGSYKATSEVDVNRAVRKKEHEYRVWSYPVKREVLDRGRYEHEKKNYTSLTHFVRIRTTYRFENIDNPEEFIEVQSVSLGLDPGDKAEGKAQTYGDKYALMKAYKIVTGEDPDHQASEEAKVPKIDNEKERKTFGRYVMDLCGEDAEIAKQVGKRAMSKVAGVQKRSELDFNVFKKADLYDTAKKEHQEYMKSVMEIDKE